jgi:pilus assembly protein CpaF
MRLAERLGQKKSDGTRNDPDSNAPSSFIANTAKRKSGDLLSEGARRLKIKVHNRLFETIDISKLESLDPSLVSTKVIAAIMDILSEDGRLLTDTDRDRLVQEIKNELLGLGPLEPLLRDESVTDIMVNGAHQVYVEKGGKLHLTDVQFYDDQHVIMHLKLIFCNEINSLSTTKMP